MKVDWTTAVVAVVLTMVVFYVMKQRGRRAAG